MFCLFSANILILVTFRHGPLKSQVQNSYYWTVWIVIRESFLLRCSSTYHQEHSLNLLQDKKWGLLLYINEILLSVCWNILLKAHKLTFLSIFNFIWVHNQCKFKNWYSNQIVETKNRSTRGIYFWLSNFLIYFLINGKSLNVLT